MTRVAIAAIDVLLDRGYGKVRVDLEIGARVDPRNMSDAELEAKLVDVRGESRGARLAVDCRVELFGYSGLDNGDTY